MSLATKLATFIERLDVDTAPRAVRERIDACLLNGYGIALGSENTPYYKVAGAATLNMEQNSTSATLFFTSRKASFSGAMLANAALFHGRAQEDTCGTVHVGAIVIPMLTALAESGRYPIARLKTALLAAYEVAGLFDGLYGRFSAANGFRATSSYGILGAATAAAKFMGLNASQIAAALSTAASFAGGVLQSFVDGTDEWRYQVGIAAHNGWCAAGLAQAGAIASTRGFEGSAGFVKAFVRVDCDVDGLAARLGNEWSALRVTFKPYPVCAFNQTPVIAALRLRERLARRSIERVRIRMNPFETRYAGMNSRGPFNSISGTLMSTPFCVATTLVHGEPTIEHMTSYNDPRVTAAMAKVAVITDESVPNLSAVIEAELSTGELISHEQKMTPADYSYDWTATSQLVRRVGSEQGVDPQSYDRLETAILDLGDGSIEEIVRLFSKRDRSLQQATTRPAYTRGESAA